MSTYNLFTDLRSPRDVTGYTLFRGTTDWSQLQQFDYFEKGYPYLVLVSTPDFLNKMADADTEVANLLNSYKHIIEYEFTGFDSTGIDDITSDPLNISNGMQDINVIGKTNMTGGTTFSMNYNERAGGTLSKMHELYLRSVRDPATGFKTYNGLISTDDNAIVKPSEISFQNETFSYLYMHTDPSGLELEQAIYWIGCYPTTANITQYTEAKRGDISFSEVTVEYQGFPLRGSAINKKAKEILDWMNSSSNNLMVHRNSWDYEYAALSDTTSGLAQSSLTSNS
jgi:hypothetical protein